MIRAVLALACVCMVVAPAVAGGCQGPLQLRLIGEQRLAPDLRVEGSAAGGLSGLDYDARRDVWIAASDDRAERGPARMYTIKLDYRIGSFAPPRFTGVAALQAPPGRSYRAAQQGLPASAEVPDIEAVRVDPQDGSIWYASEGSREFGMQPFVRRAAQSGQHIGELPLGEAFHVFPERQWGVRNNRSIEGLAFAPDGKSLWVALEAPLYQDGELPTQAGGATVRLTRFDRAGKVAGQYAYQVEPISAAAAPGKASDNGVSELLAIDEHRLLVLERSGIQSADNSFRYVVRIFEADLEGASDIAPLQSLARARYQAARKRLVLDLGTLGIEVGNLEGMSWGPRLADGKPSLVLISDDNFDPVSGTQFLAFEVDTGCAPPLKE
jgi:hypothetical protein